ncbi:hypothetical protein RB195_012723 [Necator americanus]|uniref:Uncharacterized protein n=1 Tax=Necator americanus TaxID=51031 RepID=A0ABR1DSA3_NECAM
MCAPVSTGDTQSRVELREVGARVVSGVRVRVIGGLPKAASREEACRCPCMNRCRLVVVVVAPAAAVAAAAAVTAPESIRCAEFHPPPP